MVRALCFAGGVLIGAIAVSFGGEGATQYALADATVRSTLPDGTSSEHPSTAGQVTWREWTSHSLENVGQTEAHSLAIELKKCTE